MIIALTGSKCSGKSSSLIKVTEILQKRNVSVGGIISKRIWKDGKRYGYELLNLSEKNVQLLAAEEELKDDCEKFCSFSFRKKALADGVDAINQGCTADVLIIDEIGNMESGNKGWSASFPQVAKRTMPTIICVRESVLDKLGSLGLFPSSIISLDSNHSDASGAILDILEQKL